MWAIERRTKEHPQHSAVLDLLYRPHAEGGNESLAVYMGQSRTEQSASSVLFILWVWYRNFLFTCLFVLQPQINCHLSHRDLESVFHLFFKLKWSSDCFNKYNMTKVTLFTVRILITWRQPCQRSCMWELQKTMSANPVFQRLLLRYQT